LSDYDYLVDTDILIGHLRQDPVATGFLERLTAKSIVCFSVITEVEIFVGARQKEIGPTALA